MEIRSLQQFPQESIDVLLQAIPFYKTVKQQDEWQYDLLMRYSRIIEYLPGEVILQQGQQDHWLYFLIKGQLVVFLDGSLDRSLVVNYITPGEVFGDLAVLMDQPRSATVKADSNCKKVLVFGTDFEVFGALGDLHRISLQTKLVYYRNMVHNLRWKLEVYRMTYPEHTFASNHRKVHLYTGPKETLDELRSLDEQARKLAHLLVDWNLEFDRLSLQPRETLDLQSLAAIG